MAKQVKQRNPKKGEVYVSKKNPDKTFEVTSYRQGKASGIREDGKRDKLAVTTLRKSYRIATLEEDLETTVKQNSIERARREAEERDESRRLKEAEKKLAEREALIREEESVSGGPEYLVHTVATPSRQSKKEPFARRASTVTGVKIATGVIIGGSIIAILIDIF